LPCESARAAPVLTSMSPAACMSDPSIQQFTLSGSNLAGPSTNGYTFEQDVQLYVSINRGPYQQVPGHWNATSMITGWNSSELNLSFNASVMCQAPGTLDFYAKVLGVNSNLLSIPIVAAPSGPPTIRSISPTSKPITTTDWLVSISATGLNYSSTSVSLNGVSTGFLAREDPIAGYILIDVPTALRAKAGRYQIVVATKNGSSNPVTFDILGPPHVNAVTPSTISLVRPTPSPLLARQAVALSPARAAVVGSSSPSARPPNKVAPDVALAPALFGPSFTVDSTDIDGSVRLMFAGSPLTIERSVLTYGAQKVFARLPSWTAERCGRQTYTIQLSTSLGTSNQATLVVQGKPCRMLLSPKSLTMLAPPH
jgi:hypothetical protein